MVKLVSNLHFSRSKHVKTTTWVAKNYQPDTFPIFQIEFPLASPTCQDTSRRFLQRPGDAFGTESQPAGDVQYTRIWIGIYIYMYTYTHIHIDSNIYIYIYIHETNNNQKQGYDSWNITGYHGLLRGCNETIYGI